MDNKSSLMPLAAHTLPWFALFAAAVGAAPFAVARETLQHPQLAGYALVALLMETALARLPLLNLRRGVQVLLDIIALLLFAISIVVATGLLDSHVLALFLLPLTAAAIVLSRLGYLLTALLVLLAYVALGMLTPEVQVWSSAFIIRLIGSLAPMLIATSAISLLMTQMQRAERQIKDLSSSDTLTGLMNLRAFDQLLQHTHEQAERTGQAYSLAVMDLDNLAQITQAHGHDAANQLLKVTADAVQRSIRSADTAARLGGNELVVLLQGATGSIADGVAQRIRNHVYAGTISISNRLLRAQVSIGIASFPKDRLSARELLTQATQRLQKDRALRHPAETQSQPATR